MCNVTLPASNEKSSTAVLIILSKSDAKESLAIWRYQNVKLRLEYLLESHVERK